MSNSETPFIGPNAKPPPSRLRSIGSHSKRPRERSTDSLGDTVDDARPKTRRVNPERLATRLDPRLVAEMDALIVPGAKMPNFAIRKEFQERYCVDRRHIYDYFHSRGSLSNLIGLKRLLLFSQVCGSQRRISIIIY